MSKFHQLYPSVQMQFSTGNWTQLSNEVLSHDLDGAIIAVKPEHPDIESVEIYMEELVLIASPDMGWIHEPHDLNGIDIFMWPEGCPYRKKLVNWLQRHEVSSPITSIASYGTILGCVSSGAGVSLVPKGVCEQFSRGGSLSEYVFEDLLPVKNYFVFNKNVEFHHAKDKFAELLQAEFKDLRCGF